MTDNRRVDFKDIRRRADFGAVLTHYGLKPVGKGDQLKIRCPFHDDHEPSCSVNLAKRAFHCFGCGVEGNVLDFVHRLEAGAGDGAVTIRQAALKLAGISGIELEETGARRGARKPKAGPAAPETGKLPFAAAKAFPGAVDGQEQASGKAAEPKAVNKPLGFALTLDPDHPYLAGRGLPPELVHTFGLGYCEKGIMAGRVCIPIHDAGGRIVAYAGRWVGDDNDLPEGKGKYELPAGFRKELELFNLSRVASLMHLVVVEGYFGAVRLYGERVGAVALMGSSISEEQVALLRGHCPNLRYATVLMDGDDAGRKAAAGVAARLSRHWWTHTASLPDGTQPDTVETDALRQLLGRRYR